MSVFVFSGMRGESYFIGMRNPGQQGHIPEDGGLFLLCCIDRDWAVTRCFAEEAFQAITDFNDLPNSLFACNVHQSVFEGEESKVNFFLLLKDWQLWHYLKILPLLICGWYFEVLKHVQLVLFLACTAGEKPVLLSANFGIVDKSVLNCRWFPLASKYHIICYIFFLSAQTIIYLSQNSICCFSPLPYPTVRWNILKWSF